MDLNADGTLEYLRYGYLRYDTIGVLIYGYINGEVTLLGGIFYVGDDYYYDPQGEYDGIFMSYFDECSYADLIDGKIETIELKKRGQGNENTWVNGEADPGLFEAMTRMKIIEWKTYSD